MRAILNMLGRIPRPSPAMGVALVALLLAASGAAVAAIPSADGGVNGCYDKRSGSLRIIDTGTGQSCGSKEASVRLASVDATGKVANADKLDGKDSTDFYAAGSKVADSSHADQADSATSAGDANTLDGMDSTDFSTGGGTTQKAADSELLDGKDSLEFLGVNQKAADSDKLDGKDSTDFYAAGSKVADSSHADQADSATSAGDANTLDDKDSTDFYAAGTQVADSAKLDGKTSSAFLGSNQKAADSDKLDGKDSSEFASADQFGSAVDGRIGSGGVGGLDCTLGEVRLFAGSAPASWALARGQELSIAQNTALFSLLGTNYGGDGQTTFALPDLRGAEPKGAGPAAPYYAICIEGVFPG